MRVLTRMGPLSRATLRRVRRMVETGRMSLRGSARAVRNLALGVAYLAAAWAGVHATWALDRAIQASTWPAWLPPIPAVLRGLLKAALTSAGYLPLFFAGSVAFIGVISCLDVSSDSGDRGGRDLLSPVGILLALCGLGLVFHGLGGPP